jgi:hypothetical protein
MELPQPHRADATEIAFHDPLTEETRKVRGHLMVAAVVAVMVHAFHLKPKELLDVELPEGAPALLEGALSVVLIYYFAVFSIYAYQDFRRWLASSEGHLIASSFDLLLYCRNDLNTISQLLGKITADLPLQSEVRAAVSAAAVAIPERLTRLEQLRAEIRSMTRVQWFRVTVIELGAPILLGGFSLWRVHESLLPFLRVALQ